MRTWWNNFVRWLAREELAQLHAKERAAWASSQNFANECRKVESKLSNAAFEYDILSDELAKARRANEETKATVATIRKQLQDSRETMAILQEELLAAKLRGVPAFETEFAEEAPQMNRDLRGVWRQFLNSNEAGRTLKRLANYYEQAQNRMAVLRTGEEARKAGFAHGWHACTRYFFNDLSVDVLPQTDNDTPASEADALRERFAS